MRQQRRNQDQGEGGADPHVPHTPPGQQRLRRVTTSASGPGVAPGSRQQHHASREAMGVALVQRPAAL